MSKLTQREKNKINRYVNKTTELYFVVLAAMGISHCNVFSISALIRGTVCCENSIRRVVINQYMDGKTIQSQLLSGEI
jgi:hypothetical protein